MIKGSIVAIVTPMTDDGGLDLPSLSRLLEWHIEQGTDAVVSVGTTGESATLDMAEHMRVVGHTVEVVKGRVPVIAGTGGNSTTEAIELTRGAREAGADACLLVTPYYNKPTQEGLYRHFRTIAETVDIPQILYNVPGRTACDMLPETVKRLAGVDNIIGIKEATGKVERGKEVMALCGQDFAVYSGDDPTAMELMLAGARGNVSVTANVAPALMHELCMLAMDGRADEASAVNQRLAPLNRALFLESNPIPVKWALHEMGRIGRGIRLPLVELDARYHQELRQAMQQSGVI